MFFSNFALLGHLFIWGGAAAFLKGIFLNEFKNIPFKKVQANVIRLLVKCTALHPPPLPFQTIPGYTAHIFHKTTLFILLLIILLLNKNYTQTTQIHLYFVKFQK